MSLSLAPHTGRGPSLLPWLLAGVGLAALYVPTLMSLAREQWSLSDQGHGPIVLAVSLWLLWQRWPQLMDSTGAAPKPFIAWTLIMVSGLAYALGRSQGIWLFEVGSLLPMLCGVVLLLRGARHLRVVGFAVFFLFFLVPLPGAVVDALTQPMKLAVSYVAENLLHLVGYPIARSGVIIQIGPYQLLVADACAGLHTLLTLEALGLFYLNVVRHSSWVRNLSLALLIVPISFAANVVRVIALTLITYHLGDAAGQGFLHGFAGMVLFLSALMLIVGADGLLRWLVREPAKATA